MLELLNLADQSEFNDWVAAQANAGTPVQIAYQMPNPVTYNLTAAQLAALAGYNSVSADAGTLSVTYKADTALTDWRLIT